MGLKLMGTYSELKQRCGSSSRTTSGLTLMLFRPSANAGWHDNNLISRSDNIISCSTNKIKLL